MIPSSIDKEASPIEKQVKPVCPVCGANRSTVLYASTIKPEAFALHDYGLWAGGHHPVVRCVACGMIYTSPRDSQQVLETLGQGTLESYLEQLPAKERQFRRQLSKLETLCSGPGALLEIGCAGGVFCRIAREQGWRAVGIDTWEKAVNFGKKEWDLELYSGTLSDLESGLGLFDAIVLWDVLEHLSHPGPVLKKLGKRLKPGGIIGLSTPNVDSWSRKLLGSRWQFFERYHLSFFSRKTLSSFLQDNGYTIISCRQQWKVVSLGYISRYLSKIWPGGSRLLQSLLGEGWLAHRMVTVPGGMLLCYARKEREQYVD